MVVGSGKQIIAMKINYENVPLKSVEHFFCLSFQASPKLNCQLHIFGRGQIPLIVSDTLFGFKKQDILSLCDLFPSGEPFVHKTYVFKNSNRNNSITDFIVGKAFSHSASEDKIVYSFITS